MPTARYWKFNRIRTISGANLSLSEIAIYDDATRLDSGATITSTVPPIAGSLSDLSDEDFDTSVTWNAEDLHLPGFAIHYDLGSALDVSKTSIAGPSLINFANGITVSYSTDNVSWTELFTPEVATTWTDATTFYDLSTGVNPNTVLQVQGAGSGSTITDNGPLAQVGTIFGSVSIDTTEFKYGVSSIRLNGGYVGYPTSNSSFDFTGVDFTIQFWVRIAAATTQYVLTHVDPNAVTNTGLAWVFAYGGGTSQVQFDVSSGNATPVSLVSNGTLTVGQWHHIAITRTGNVYRLFLDGVLDVSATNASVVNYSSAFSLRIGKQVDSSPLASNCNVDDLQILKGESLYTADFTPPGELSSGSSGEPDVGGIGVTGSTTYKVDTIDGGTYKISGLIYKKGFPDHLKISRQIMLFDRLTQRRIASVWSDPITGYYEFTNLKNQNYFVVAFDYTGQHNSESVDDIYPVNTLPNYVIPEPPEPEEPPIDEGSDSDYANVKYLLHFNGANGSTTFTDNSSPSKTMTINGAVQISTAQSKFGGASGYFNGSGAYITGANAADAHIANNDFTIEAWVMRGEAGWGGYLASTRAIIGLTQGWEIAITGAGNLYFAAYADDAFPIDFNGTAVIPINEWTHVAISRVGSTTRSFVNGVLDSTDTTSGPINQGTVLHIGRMILGTSNDWKGYIDDFRITLGVGRYSSNFTPPTEAFPNKGPTYTLGSTNLMTALTPDTAFLVVSPGVSGTLSRVNDGAPLDLGNIGGTAFMNTTGASSGENNGAGLQINFGTNRRIGRIETSSYGASNNAIFDWQVQYFDGSVWINAGAAVPNISSGFSNYSVMNIPSDLGISVQYWRVIVTNWTGTNNLYMGEVRAYEWIAP